MSQIGRQSPGKSNASISFNSPTWNISSRPISRTVSWTSNRESTYSSTTKFADGNTGHRTLPLGGADISSDSDEMEDRRPGLHRPTDGRSHQPLLHKDDDLERGRTGYASPDIGDRPPLFTRRSTMRSRSPDTQAKLATRKKYTYAAFFLGLSLISFTIQTETAVYIQHELKWNKAYCML